MSTSSGTGQNVTEVLLQLLQRLQGGDDVAHQRPSLWVAVKAMVCQHRRLLHSLHRVVLGEPRVYYAKHLLLLRQHRECPVGQRLLPDRPGLVQRLPAREELQEDNTVAVDIAHRREMPWGCERTTHWFLEPSRVQY